MDLMPDKVVSRRTVYARNARTGGIGGAAEVESKGLQVSRVQRIKLGNPAIPHGGVDWDIIEQERQHPKCNMRE